MEYVKVPKEFIDALEKSAEPSRKIIANLIKAILWASENPEEAVKIARGLKKLKATGRKTFLDLLPYASDPRAAFQIAFNKQARISGERSRLSKFLSAIRRHGFKFFALPNGVKCSATRQNDKYFFSFEVGGEVVTLVADAEMISEVLKNLEAGHICQSDFESAIYKGREYDIRTEVAAALTNAVRAGVEPGVAAVLED